MPVKRTTNELSKSDKKVLRIGTSAARLFSTKGYIETSMDEIAAVARMSKGGMYHYFGSKRDILNFVLSTFMDLILENVEQDLQKTDDPAELIRLIIFRHVKIYSEHMYLAKTLLHEAHNLPSVQLKKIKSKEKTYFGIISGALSSYLGESCEKDTLTVLTFNMLGMCNWIYSWYNPKGVINPEKLAQIIFDTFIVGLASFKKDAGLLSI